MNKCVLLVLTASLTFGSACKRAIEKTETASVSANITEKQEATMTDDSKGKEFLETFYDGMDKIDGDDFDLDKVYAHIKDNSTEHAIDVLKELYEKNSMSMTARENAWHFGHSPTEHSTTQVHLFHARLRHRATMSSSWRTSMNITPTGLS